MYKIIEIKPLTETGMASWSQIIKQVISLANWKP